MKKINKYIKYMLFAVVLCVVTTGNVFASCSGEKNACIECEYSFDYLGKTPTVTLKAVDDGSGNIAIKNKTLGGEKSGFELADVNVYGSSFKPTAGKKLICPTLYYDVKEPQNTGQPGAVQGNNKIDISTNKNNAFEILTKKIIDQNRIDLYEDTKNNVSCSFKVDIKDSTCKVSEKDVQFEFNIINGVLPGEDITKKYSLVFNDGLTANDFIKNGECNFEGYLICQAGKTNTSAINYAPSCTFSKEEKICTSKEAVKDPEKIDKEENKDDKVTDKDSGGITFGDGDGDCKYVLGQILDDIQNIFDIVKILAPILVIVFGTLDFVKATIAMDDKGMKTAMNKFPRRLIAAAALFFLPYIINLLLSLPGLEIENAVCGISKVVFKLW